MVIQLRTVEKWGPDRIAGHLATVGDGSISLSPDGREGGAVQPPMKEEWLSARALRQRQ
jgi:hypothetical protein